MVVLPPPPLPWIRRRHSLRWVAVKSLQSIFKVCQLRRFHYPAPGRGTGRVILFGRFLSLFLCEQHYKKTAGPICMKFSGKVWSDHGTTSLNFGSIRINGSAGQKSICLLSPAIAQRTGVNKSVSFARWQQGAGFVVPRTTACLHLWISWPFVPIFSGESRILIACPWNITRSFVTLNCPEFRTLSRFRPALNVT